MKTLDLNSFHSFHLRIIYAPDDEKGLVGWISASSKAGSVIVLPYREPRMADFWFAWWMPSQLQLGSSKNRLRQPCRHRTLEVF